MQTSSTHFVRLALAAAMLAGAGLVGTAPVSAQGAMAPQAVQPGAVLIQGLDVTQVPRLDPGTELEFALWGTADAQGVVAIEGAARNVALSQVSAGYYKGYYTVGTSDRIAPNARVTANLRIGNQVATAQLNESLVAGYQPPAGTAAQAPRISRFDLTQGPSQREGQVVQFALTGTPGGKASVRIPGAAVRSINLNEGKAGAYSGSYTVTAADQIRANQPVTARLTLGDRTETATLTTGWDKPLPAVGLAGSTALCADCWTVTAINQLEVDGDGNYIGTIAGAVLGGVVGSQVGGGDGRTAAAVAGAIGGALLGREIDRRKDRRTTYEVLLRNERGEQRTVSQPSAPAFQVGAVVRQTAAGALEAVPR